MNIILPSIRFIPKSLLLIVLFVGALNTAVFAQESEETDQPVNTEGSVPQAVDPTDPDAIGLSVSSKVYNYDSEVIWSLDSLEYTKPGQKVQVKIVGSSVIVLAEFTPFPQEDGSFLLVSQGQVWMKKPESEEMNIRSAMNALTVIPGEAVFFYPLGIKKEQMQPESTVLEMQIIINPLNSQDTVE